MADLTLPVPTRSRMGFSLVSVSELSGRSPEITFMATVWATLLAPND